MAKPSRMTPLAGSERPRAAGARLIEPLPPAELISVTLIIRPRPGSPPLPDLAHWQRTPPGKRRFLSPEEFAQTYGAAQADLDAVLAFVAAQGMTVLDNHAGRRNVTVQGTAAQMNAAFGVRLNRYEAPLPAVPQRTRAGAEGEPAAATQIHIGYDSAVHLPTELVDIVTAVVGLDDRSVGVPAGSGDPSPANSLLVSTIAGYYNFPNSGASDQTIGVIAPQNSPGNGASYLANDINGLYFPNLPAGYRTKPASINDVNLTVGTNTYSNSAATVQGINNLTNLNAFPYSFIIEVTQDISTATTIAQGATVNVYFTQNSEQGWLVFLNRVLLPAGEKQPTVVTCSFTIYNSDDSATIGSISNTGSVAHVMSSLFQQLALLGINVFIAVGDWGADDSITDGKTHVMYPGSDPWITSCGGTIVGNVKSGPPLAFDEWVWSDAFSSSAFGSSTSDFGATGGGASANFPVPDYQTAVGITQVKDSKNNALVGRFVPDIAGMVAYSGFYVNGISYNFTGTSCVAPLYAGLAAVLRSAFGISLGFLNPTLYQLVNTAFNDVTKGNNDSGDTPDSPYFTAGVGWDACTGLGSTNGTKLLNGIAALMYTQTFYFQMEKNTYGLDEVGVIPSYPGAFSLVLEGFTPTAAAGITPTVTGAFTALSGVTVTVGTAQPELPSQPSTPQRILYPCSVAFASTAVKTVAQGGVFPAPGGIPFELPLTALMTVGGQIFAAATVFELVAGADPHFSNFNTRFGNVFYLSQDLRVFTVTPGVNKAPIGGVALSPANNTSFDTRAGFSYIQALLNYLDANYSDPAGTDPFTLFPDQSSALTGDSSVTPSTIDPSNLSGAPFANYNFAVARVRMSGQANTSSVKNVRVFFRMFATQTNDTDYRTDWTYPSTLDSSNLPASPLLGVGNPPVTIPFFATGNYEANADFGIKVDYSANSINNRPIQIGASGSVWAYYGCYINIYPLGNSINGQAVNAMLPGTHHCIVAQIASDDAPIVNSNGTTESPENSDKLAQRNLEITFSDNPGPAATHRIPQTFDLRRSAALSGSSGSLLDYPDELMIDWGNTPVGSMAYIYWPQVSVADVLSLATQLYSTHQLSAADANTVRCGVPNGFTYVPIPPGSGENFAGLFTVDLPVGVVTGQVFTIVVRRISTRRAEEPPPIQIQARTEAAAREKAMRNWRYVVGTFAVRIPVSTANLMLPLEEDTLAIMKWRLAQMSPGNRWYPVLQRYIDYIAGRVDGLGGNSTAIGPSPWGAQPPMIHKKRHEDTGKVDGVIYDRFGDFDGFLLRTEHGHERLFQSRESEIEALVRFAWQQRVVITVITEPQDPHCPLSIILRRSPQPRHWEP